MTEFHHGITAREAAIGKIPLRNADTNTIAILAFSDDADEAVFPLNKPVLVTSINRVLPAAGTQGNLRKNLEIIASITSPTLVVIRIEDPFEDGFEQSRVIGTTNETGQRTGLQALLTVKSVLGITPKIICISDTETIDVANALGAICKKLRAYSYITPRNEDGQILQNAEAVSAYRGMLAFREIELIWPEWTSGNVFLGSENQNGAISAGIMPDLYYGESDFGYILWEIEIDGVLQEETIGRVNSEEWLYLEDYLQANKEILGITCEYISDENTDFSAVYIRNITNTRKFVRLIPDTAYTNEIKLLGNPTAKIDSDGVISFWLEANSEVIKPEPEPEPVCNCEQSWVLIPELTPATTLNENGEVFVSVKDLYQSNGMALSNNKPIIEIIEQMMTNVFSEHLELIRCDSEGTLLRNKTDDCLTLAIWGSNKNSSGNKEYISFLPETDLCAYDASEVIPEGIPENWDIKYLVNGTWIYEVTGPVIEQSEERNNKCRNAATALVLADSVTEIAMGVFAQWRALNSIDFGQSLTTIGRSGFSWCENMTKFVFPDSLSILGTNAIANCQKVTSLEFGTGLTEIGNYAILDLKILEVIVFRARVMPKLGTNALITGVTGATLPRIYVPDDLFDEYEGVIWNLARKDKYLPLSTYVS